MMNQQIFELSVCVSKLQRIRIAVNYRTKYADLTSI